MGLKLRRFRHRMSLEPVTGLGEISGTVQARADSDHRPLRAQESSGDQGSFIGRYRRMEDGFDPESAERRPVSNVGIPAYVMARKPKIDLRLPSVMRKMYGHRNSRDEILQDTIAANDVNDNYRGDDFAKAQQKFDQLGGEDAIPGIRKRKESKPKRGLMLNFRSRGFNKTRSLVINSQPVVKAIPAYDIDQEVTYKKITNISDDVEYLEARTVEHNKKERKEQKKAKVERVIKTIPEYDIDEDPMYRRMSSQNVTRLEITSESVMSAYEIPVQSKPQDCNVIEPVPDYINEIIVEDVKEDSKEVPEYLEVIREPKDIYKVTVGVPGYKEDHGQWYNEKYIGNNNDVEYLELTSDTSNFNGPCSVEYNSKEWYEDDDSVNSSSKVNVEQEKAMKRISEDKHEDHQRKNDDIELHSNARFMKDLRLKIYPIENIDDDWGYHGSNDQSYNEQENLETTRRISDAENIKDTQSGMLKRQRQWPSMSKTVTFRTPSELSSSTRTSLESEEIFDAWEIVEECEKNLRIREEEEEMNVGKYEDHSPIVESEPRLVQQMEAPVPTPRLSIQQNKMVTKFTGNPETGVKYRAVVSELKKTRSYSDTEA